MRQQEEKLGVAMGSQKELRKEIMENGPVEKKAADGN